MLYVGRLLGGCTMLSLKAMYVHQYLSVGNCRALMTVSLNLCVIIRLF
jgi:hypothetical protein